MKSLSKSIDNIVKIATITNISLCENFMNSVAYYMWNKVKIWSVSGTTLKKCWEIEWKLYSHMACYVKEWFNWKKDEFSVIIDI